MVVDWILETRVRANHLSAGHWICEQIPNAKLAIGTGIREVQKIFCRIFNLGQHFPVGGSQFDRLLSDSEILDAGGLSIQVLATSGHTGDSVSYLIGKTVFVGDTLVYARWWHGAL